MINHDDGNALRAFFHMPISEQLDFIASMLIIEFIGEFKGRLP
jgi:hypothetical protein